MPSHNILLLIDFVAYFLLACVLRSVIADRQSDSLG